jgi:hypothetical protein
MILPIEASGATLSGETFSEKGTLSNISVWGALVRVQKALPVGLRVELSVKLPVVERWMIYTGEIIRVESDSRGFGFAVKFDSAAPDFKRE